MTYLSRQVFEFEVDWGQTPRAGISYDLREMANPFGVLAYAPTQRHVVTAWDLTLRLEGSAQLLAWDTFEAATQGRLVGFWFPTTSQIALVADQSLGGFGVGDEYKILVEDAGLVDLWNTYPELHIWLSASGQTSIAAEVTGVTAGPTGYEVLTLSIPRPDIDPGWMLTRLLYARFASDENEREIERPDLVTLQIRVVELPTEYASLETGRTKVWFYRFFHGGPGTAVDAASDWFYTSFPADIASTYGGAIASQVHTSKPVSHGQIVASIEELGSTLDLSGVYEVGGPFERMFPRKTGLPLWLEVRWADYAAPNATTLLYTGEAQRASAEGSKLRVGFNNAGFARRRFPVLQRQSWCSYKFGDADTCKKSLTGLTKAVTVSAVSGRLVTITGSGLLTTAAAYADGLVDIGTGRAREIISVRTSADAGGGAVTLTLAREPRFAAAATGNLTPGCRKSAADCEAYGNYVNFPGLQFMPDSNPTVTPAPRESGNNKK